MIMMLHIISWKQYAKENWNLQSGEHHTCRFASQIVTVKSWDGWTHMTYRIMVLGTG